ncbi:MAG: hypothetical protein HY305_03165 [Sphingobacteriales bacterium]|nr:hypothetical protein [Sphingobacteriales bacterium]
MIQKFYAERITIANTQQISFSGEQLNVLPEESDQENEGREVQENFDEPFQNDEPAPANNDEDEDLERDIWLSKYL